MSTFAMIGHCNFLGVGFTTLNRPRSIYQYSSMAPSLSGQNCKFFKLLLSLNSQKRLGYKENNTKYRILTRKPRGHARILIYRTWPIENGSHGVCCNNFKSVLINATWPDLRPINNEGLEILACFIIITEVKNILTLQEESFFPHLALVFQTS